MQISRECTPPYLSTGISNLLQPAQAEVVQSQPFTYLASWVEPTVCAVHGGVNLYKDINLRCSFNTHGLNYFLHKNVKRNKKNLNVSSEKSYYWVNEDEKDPNTRKHLE